MGERVLGERRHQRVARRPTLARRKAAIETEAGDLEDVGGLRRRLLAQLAIEAVEDMWARGGQQPRRGEMASVAVGEHQIGRVGVVELVDLIGAVDHRHIPFEQIDEDGFARGEHRAEHAVRGRARGRLHDVKHVWPPLAVGRPRVCPDGGARYSRKG